MAVAASVVTAAFGAGGLVAPPLTIGCNLQTTTTISLGETAPAEGLKLTITSDDPSALLLATQFNEPGKPSITIEVKGGLATSPEFFVQALRDSGSATYSATALGFGSVQGTVTLTPSAILMMGPMRAPSFRTTPRGAPARLSFYSVRLDSSLAYVEQQAVAGIADVKVEIEVSDPAVGTVTDSVVVIPRGTAVAATEFRPGKVGTATLSARTPPGFSSPRENKSLSAVVVKPGMMVTGDVMIGQNLQIGGLVGLGEPAPEEGLTITLTTDDPSLLVLSDSATKVGAKTLELKLKAGAVSAPFYLQAVAGSGTVSYTATAPGYQGRTGTVQLAPSGVVVLPRPYGPPDEAEVMRPHDVHAPRGIVASKSKNTKVPLAIWTVQLDPVTRRSADITVQPLGPGAPLEIVVESSDARVGKVQSPVKVVPGSEFAETHFLPAAEGSTVISVRTPRGFTESSNSTSFTAIVRP